MVRIRALRRPSAAGHSEPCVEANRIQNQVLPVGLNSPFIRIYFRPWPFSKQSPNLNFFRQQGTFVCRVEGSRFEWKYHNVVLASTKELDRNLWVL
jgi:uncharacterized protein (DUF1919 family)